MIADSEHGGQECVNRDYSEAILTELFDGIYRYPGNNNGALRKAGNIYDRGFKKYSEDIWGGYYADRDTYRREWYVYLPDSAPKDQPVPAVFVFHGAGGSGDEIADRIGWSYVAEKYGFIIIMPSAPNRMRCGKSVISVPTIYSARCGTAEIRSRNGRRI
ncbi:MAG: hypothetical protein V8S58_11830 [Lachnospiraceae bacterium]